MERVLWSVVEEHLDEAEYLYRRWEDALDAPEFGLRKAVKWEERLKAQLDGVSAAGPSAVERLLEPALEAEDPNRVCAAALAMLHSDLPNAVERIVERLPGSDAPEPLLRALCLSPRPVTAALTPLLTASAPGQQAWALEVMAFGPVAYSQHLVACLSAKEPAVAASALRAVRYAGASLAIWVQRGLTATDLRVRDAAIEAGLLGGIRAAWAVAQQAVERGVLRSDLPLHVLAMSGEAADVERLGALLRSEEERSAALFALGFSGSRRAVELCLPFLRHAKLNRLAGEVVSAVAGLELKGEFALPEVEAPEEPVAIEDEPPASELLPALDDRMPRPNVEAVERWWSGNRQRFAPDRRYLAGREWSPEAVFEALTRGPMRRRHVLALEAAIRSRGRFRLETRTWLSEQRCEPEALKQALPESSLAPFGELLRQ
jgi:uncharacterized protein (TIGR02270 family)